MKDHVGTRGAVIAAAVMAAALWALTGTAALASQNDAVKNSANGTLEEFVAAQFSGPGETIAGKAREIAQKVKEDAMDPEGKDAFVTASGKVLRRTDGKWIFPEKSPARGDEISIVFTGDIIFDTWQNPWSSIA